MWFIGIADKRSPSGRVAKYWNRKKRAFCDTDPVTGYDTWRGAARASVHGVPYRAWGEIVRALENGYDICIITEYKES